MIWAKRIAAFIVAVAVTSAVGAAMHSQFVIANLAELGHAISLGQRLSWTGHDIVGMFATYAPIIAVSFLLGFPIAALITRNRAHLRTVGYTLAGAAAVVCALLLMKQLLELSGVAGARTAFGIFCQAIAGAVGGWTFARIVRSPSAGV